MKVYLTIVAFLLCLGCSFAPDIQVEAVCVKLVSVEEIYREGEPIYIYRWHDEKTNMAYVQYSKRPIYYKKGECVSLLVRR